MVSKDDPHIARMKIAMEKLAELDVKILVVPEYRVMCLGIPDWRISDECDYGCSFSSNYLFYLDSSYPKMPTTYISSGKSS